MTPPRTTIDPSTLREEVRRIEHERFVAIYTSQRSVGFFLSVVAFAVVFAGLPLIPAVRGVLRVSPFELATGLAFQIGAIGIATLAARRPGGLFGKAHRRAEHLETFVIAAVGAALIRVSDSGTSVFWLISIMHAFFGSQDVLNARFTRLAHGVCLGASALSFAVIGRLGEASTVVFIAAVGLFLAKTYEQGIRETITREAERTILRDRYERLLVEGERGRIARDLHDAVGSHLAAIAWGAEALAKETEDDALRELSTRARTSMKELREVVRGLKGVAMPLADLAAALSRAVDDLASNHARRVKHAGTVTLRAELGVEVTSIVREAVRNAVQHARATRIEVSLDATLEGRFVVRIEDDGRGLPAGAIEASTGGLANLRERAAILGGRVDFSSSPDGTGTVVVVDLPIGRGSHEHAVTSSPG